MGCKKKTLKHNSKCPSTLCRRTREGLSLSLFCPSGAAPDTRTRTALGTSDTWFASTRLRLKCLVISRTIGSISPQHSVGVVGKLAASNLHEQRNASILLLLSQRLEQIFIINREDIDIFLRLSQANSRGTRFTRCPVVITVLRLVIFTLIRSKPSLDTLLHLHRPSPWLAGSTAQAEAEDPREHARSEPDDGEVLRR